MNIIYPARGWGDLNRGSNVSQFFISFLNDHRYSYQWRSVEPLGFKLFLTIDLRSRTVSSLPVFPGYTAGKRQLQDPGVRWCEVHGSFLSVCMFTCWGHRMDGYSWSRENLWLHYKVLVSGHIWQVALEIKYHTIHFIWEKKLCDVF